MKMVLVTRKQLENLSKVKLIDELLTTVYNSQYVYNKYNWIHEELSNPTSRFDKLLENWKYQKTARNFSSSEKNRNA